MLKLRSKVTQAVLLYFFTNPTARVYVNALARLLKLDSGNLSRKLIELESFGLLKSEWQGEQRYYSLNKSFKLLKEYKKVIEQTLSVDKILQVNLKKVKGITKAFLYGSYAQQRMDEKSDIDFMVIGTCDVIEVQEAIGKVEKMLGRDINTMVIDPLEYKERLKTDPFFIHISKAKRIEVIDEI